MQGIIPSLLHVITLDSTSSLVNNAGKSSITISTCSCEPGRSEFADEEMDAIHDEKHGDICIVHCINGQLIVAAPYWKDNTLLIVQ